MALRLIPYTNFHELNLDWLLLKMKELDEKLDGKLDEYIEAYINEYMARFSVNVRYDAPTRTLIIEEVNNA